MSRSKSRTRTKSRSRSRSRSRRTSRSYSRSRSPSSRSHSRSRSKTPVDKHRLHVRDIGSSITRRDIEKEFERYGTLLEVWMSRTRPSFAFVVYKRDKDAAEAQKRTNGMELYGSFLTVSFAKTRGLSRRSSRNNNYRDSLRCYSCNRVGHFSRSCKEVNYGYRR